jgi:hypothetical protein
MYESDLPPQDIIVLCVELDIVFLEIGIKFVGAQDFCDFDQLVIVVVTMEERLLAEDLYLQS